MRRTLLLISVLSSLFFIAVTPPTFGDEDIPKGMESSISKWAEARAKAKLMMRPLPSKADSAHAYDVLFYRLNLYFPITADSLKGKALIRCRSEEDNLSSIHLHLRNLAVDSVFVDGVPFSWNLAHDALAIQFETPFLQNDTFEVSVVYGGSPSAGYYTTGSGELRTGYTITEPSGSRYWFPCWDEPWDKADEGCEIHAEVPLGFVVASNGLLTGIDTTYFPSDTTVTYHWVESYPITTYLMSVAIARYAQILDVYLTGTGDSLEVRHFVYREDSSRAVANFGDTPEMMTFFASLFGEYPFEKYGMACVTGFGGGMEHQTMTTISKSAARDGAESLIAHELAHMWWGDMVTCFDWPEIWLNEGFATYSEAMWHEHTYGFNSFKAKMTEYGNDYLHGSYTTHPLYDPPVLFSWSHVYTKGAWVLHMLRHMVGDSLYSQILQAYGETFKYGNATTEDFRGVVDSVMNDTFNYYFQQWVYSPEHPHYEYGWQVEALGGESYLFSLQIRQIQQDGPLFSMPVDLKLNYPGGDTTFTVWVNAHTFQEITLPLSLPEGLPTFTLSFDPDNWLLDEHQEVPYVTARVAATSPVQNELHVPVSTDISVTFDNDMDETTIHDSTFTVNASFTGRHEGIIAYDSFAKTAIFDPANDFDEGEVITVSLTEGIQSSQGMALKDGYTYSFTAAVGGGSAIFLIDSTYATDEGPTSVSSADLDGDGDLDLATANQASNDVFVLLNQGDAIFTPALVHSVGNGPRSIFAADLDGDGDLDLATANNESDSVSVLLNDGNGNFGPHSLHHIGMHPVSVFAADIDSDGDLDLAAANQGSNDVSVLLNNGDGTFAPYSAYPVGDTPHSVIAADLNSDGGLDLTTANQGSNDVSVLLNNGDGTFAPYSAYPVGDTPHSVIAADLNGDGDLDLATANQGSNDVSVLLNNGDGILAPYSAYPVGDTPHSIIAADFDSDGDLDLATANCNSANVSVLLNLPAYACGDCNGDGSLNFADALYLKNHYYQTPPGSPPPIGEGDVNVNGNITFADALYIKNFYYQSPPGSPAPCNPPTADTSPILRKPGAR